MNALEYVVFPKISSVMKYIEQEKEEQAREEFFRIKKIVQTQKLKMAKEVRRSRLRLLVCKAIVTNKRRHLALLVVVQK